MIDDFHHALTIAVRSNKQAHFDSVMDELRQWHHKHGGHFETEFAEQVVDIFEYTIRSDHRDNLPIAMTLLSDWIVRNASNEVVGKMFDVVNNARFVKNLLNAVDEPKMLHNCSLENILYNQAGVVHRKVESNELMLFVHTSATRCIHYIFSSPFVVGILNESDSVDKSERKIENDYFFWSLTDEKSHNNLPHVLDALLSQQPTQWINHYMKAVCTRTSLECLDMLVTHPKFTDKHTTIIEQFFHKPVSMAFDPVDFIKQIKPYSVGLQAYSAHLAHLFMGGERKVDKLTLELQQMFTGLSSIERVEVVHKSLDMYHSQLYAKNNRLPSVEQVFDTIAPFFSAHDLDYWLEHNNMPEVRNNPLVLQRILLREVGGATNGAHKRKI